ncbi:MAG: Flp family type IVb pilin [Marinomonas sp.]|nr:MAG: Flp family type IVb pilin [Marinomonas sp.]
MITILYKKLMMALGQFLTSKDGVAATEYAVIAVGVAGVIAIVFGSDDGALETTLSGLVSQIADLTSTP